MIPESLKAIKKLSFKGFNKISLEVAENVLLHRGGLLNNWFNDNRPFGVCFLNSNAVIDLSVTVQRLKHAFRAVGGWVESSRRTSLLLVSNDPFPENDIAVENAASILSGLGYGYVVRWLPGYLVNMPSLILNYWRNVGISLKQSAPRNRREKIAAYNYKGLRQLLRFPDLVLFFSGGGDFRFGVNEAKRLNLPTLVWANTNIGPKNTLGWIPSDDTGPTMLRYMTTAVKEVVLRGLKKELFSEVSTLASQYGHRYPGTISQLHEITSQVSKPFKNRIKVNEKNKKKKLKIKKKKLKKLKNKKKNLFKKKQLACFYNLRRQFHYAVDFLLKNNIPFVENFKLVNLLLVKFFKPFYKVLNRFNKTLLQLKSKKAYGGLQLLNSLTFFKKKKLKNHFLKKLMNLITNWNFWFFSLYKKIVTLNLINALFIRRLTRGKEKRVDKVFIFDTKLKITSHQIAFNAALSFSKLTSKFLRVGRRLRNNVTIVPFKFFKNWINKFFKLPFIKTINAKFPLKNSRKFSEKAKLIITVLKNGFGGIKFSKSKLPKVKQNKLIKNRKSVKQIKPAKKSKSNKLFNVSKKFVYDEKPKENNEELGVSSFLLSRKLYWNLLKISKKNKARNLYRLQIRQKRWRILASNWSPFFEKKKKLTKKLSPITSLRSRVFFYRFFLLKKLLKKKLKIPNILIWSTFGLKSGNPVFFKKTQKKLNRACYRFARWRSHVAPTAVRRVGGLLRLPALFKNKRLYRVAHQLEMFDRRDSVIYKSRKKGAQRFQSFKLKFAHFYKNKKKRKKEENRWPIWQSGLKRYLLPYISNSFHLGLVLYPLTLFKKFKLSLKRHRNVLKLTKLKKKLNIPITVAGVRLFFKGKKLLNKKLLKQRNRFLLNQQHFFSWLRTRLAFKRFIYRLSRILKTIKSFSVFKLLKKINLMTKRLNKPFKSLNYKNKLIRKKNKLSSFYNFLIKKDKQFKLLIKKLSNRLSFLKKRKKRLSKIIKRFLRKKTKRVKGLLVRKIIVRPFNSHVLKPIFNRNRFKKGGLSKKKNKKRRWTNFWHRWYKPNRVRVRFFNLWQKRIKVGYLRTRNGRLKALPKVSVLPTVKNRENKKLNIRVAATLLCGWSAGLVFQQRSKDFEFSLKKANSFF